MRDKCRESSGGFSKYSLSSSQHKMQSYLKPMQALDKILAEMVASDTFSLHTIATVPAPGISDISSRLGPHQSIKCIYKPILHQPMSKCYTETQPKTSNSKQCRWRSRVARKNSLERLKPREEPGSEGWPVLFWRL
jgi:hypothetical protein